MDSGLVLRTPRNDGWKQVQPVTSELPDGAGPTAEYFALSEVKLAIIDLVSRKCVGHVSEHLSVMSPG